jgi:ferredoxin
VKVKADYDLCESNALCESFAPDVFEIDDNDDLQILDDQVTDENKSRIDQAVAACPKAALSLVADGEA